MIETGHEQGGLAKHAVPADEPILNGNGQRVPNVQASGDVGWWTGNDELALWLGLSVGCQLGLEEALG